MNAAYGKFPWLIEVSDRARVLALSVFNGNIPFLIKCINGKAPACSSRTASQELETLLPDAFETQ
jgi:hypothetical protein